MDSLTARHLARELDHRWRGQRVDACVFDRAHETVTMSAGGFAVCFDLGQPDVRVRLADPPPPDKKLHEWIVRGVRAPEDDRRLSVDIVRPGRFKGSSERWGEFEVSVMPWARGALLRDQSSYWHVMGFTRWPAVEPRPVLGDDDVVAACREGDPDRLLRGRWMSPRVARWVCADPDAAAERYRLICSGAPAQPSRCGDRVFPFPYCADAVPVESLVEPREAPVAAPPSGADERRERARARLRDELESAANAPLLRRLADALVALGDGPPPAMVMLADGSTRPVPARPGERSADVAARLYAEARSKERALQAVPKRLAALDAAPSPRSGNEPTVRPGRARPAARLPYRTYRSSGGFDIWVGRGAASNDELTFHVASPNDVWLHARDDAGAHVVLRFTGEDSPPARDLEEAALLAAWHSKSRGSSVVPVDWTRRKHVRKPRGAKPGTVVLQQSRTIMVRPRQDVERRLRAAGPSSV